MVILILILFCIWFRLKPFPLFMVFFKVFQVFFGTMPFEINSYLCFFKFFLLDFFTFALNKLGLVSFVEEELVLLPRIDSLGRMFDLIIIIVMIKLIVIWGLTFINFD